MSHVPGHTGSEPAYVYDATHEGTGTSTATPTPTNETASGQETISGQTIIGPDGQLYQVEVLNVPSAGVNISGGQGQLPGKQFFATNLQTGESVKLGASDYYTTSGFVISTDATGNKLEQRAMTESERKALGISAGQGGDDGTGGASGPSIYGTRAPDPGGAITALMNQYDLMLKDASIPNENAKNWLAAELEKIEAQANYEVNQATIDQNAATGNNRAQNDFDTLNADIAASKETGLRSREIARADRGLGIQQERGDRANTALDLLKTSLPNTASMNVPLFGEMDLAQVNPDQFLDIAGLNNIPDISPNLGADFGTPQAPMNVPNPQLTPVNAGALPPGYAPIAQPPLPPLDELIKSVIAGFQGWSA